MYNSLGISSPAGLQMFKTVAWKTTLKGFKSKAELG